MESAFFSLDLISKRLVIHLRSNLRAIANFDFEIPKLHRLHHLHRRGKQGPSSTKRRRDRINEKMRALQELIPNCNKETPVLVKRFAANDDQFWSVLKILSRVRHRNILNLVGYCCTDASVFLLFDYPRSGTIEMNLLYDESAKRLSWRVRWYIALEIGIGLRYLHEECVDGPIADLCVCSPHVVFSHGSSVMSRSVQDFDNYATRVLGKYETVDAYYRHNSSTNFVGNVMVPLLCISALDDPVCTREAIPWDECRCETSKQATTNHSLARSVSLVFAFDSNPRHIESIIRSLSRIFNQWRLDLRRLTG